MAIKEQGIPVLRPHPASGRLSLRYFGGIGWCRRAGAHRPSGWLPPGPGLSGLADRLPRGSTRPGLSGARPQALLSRGPGVLWRPAAPGGGSPPPCFRGDESFSFPELHKGLDRFRSEPECRGCKGRRGLKDCAIKHCAMGRNISRCLECHSLETCECYNIIFQESSSNIPYLHCYVLRNKFDNL